jgi:hypothetical protein
VKAGTSRRSGGDRYGYHGTVWQAAVAEREQAAVQRVEPLHQQQAHRQPGGAEDQQRLYAQEQPNIPSRTK